MNALLIATVSNVVVAALMAVAVIGISRLCKRPALVHSLWVLVLLKLVTPPVIHVPVPIAAWDTPRNSSAVTSRAHDASSDRVGGMPAATRAGDPAAAPLPLQGFEGDTREAELAVDDQLDATPLNPIPVGGMEEVQPEADNGKRGRHGFAGPMDVAASDPATRTSTPNSAVRESRASSPDREAETSLTAAESPSIGPSLLQVLAALWAAGSIFCLLVTALRIVWFRQLLKHAEAAPHGLQTQAAELAARLGLPRAPEVRLLPGAVSPMLWAGGRRPLLLFPRELLAHLDERSRAMLLLHELAHLRRGDHWVRLLELLVSCAYWWNPVVWWARREIHRTEEECCDALVVEHSVDGGRTYATALLDTIDFLAGAKPLTVPPATSGIGHVKFVRHRLKQIFDGTTSGLLPRTARLAVLLAAVVFLPLLPTFARGDAAEDNREVQSTAATKTEEKADPGNRRPTPRSTGGLVASAPLEFESSPQSLQFSPLETRTIDVSSDGRWLASGHGKWTTEGHVRVWDLKSHKEVATFTEKKGVSSVRFSPDDKLLASACWGNGVIRIRELPSLKERHAIPLGSVARVAFSPDGKTLAAATESQKLTFWDVKTGKSLPGLEGKFFRMQYVTYSKDGRYLAVCGGKFSTPRNGRVAVWDLKTKKQLEIRDLSAPVVSVAFSPDGKTLAACGFDRRVHAYSVPTMKEIFTLAVSRQYLECVTFSPDGKLLLSTGYDGTVQLSDPTTGTNVGMLTGHTGSGTMEAAFSSDSKTIYTCGTDSTIRIWDAATYKQAHVLQPGETAAEVPEAVLSVAVSPTGDVVASAHEDKTVRLRNPETGAILRTLRGHDDVVAGLAFTSDGKTLATAGLDKTIKLWNVADGKLLRTLQGHTNWVFAVVFSPDDKRLISGGYDKTLRVWNVADGKLVATLEGHAATVRCLAISHDGTWIASGSGDKTVKLWNAKTLKEVRTLKGHKGTVRAVTFSPDGATLATASEDTTIKQWSVADGKEIRTLQGHRGMVWTLAWSPRGATLASGGFDNSLIIWDPKTGRRLQTLRGHTDVVTSLAFVPGSKGLFSGSYDKSIRFWKAKLPPLTELVTFAAHPSAARCVDFSPDGRWMVTGGQDRLVKLWSMRTGQLVRVLRGHAGGVRTIAFSPDSRLIASAGWGPALIIWNAATGKKAASLSVGRHDVMSVRFSPDGSRLVSCGRDKTARIWDMKSFKQLHATPAQQQVLSGLDVSPDGKTFVTCSGDYKQPDVPGIVKLWDLKTGRELATLAGHTKCINFVRFSPDGKRIATAGRDVTKLWDVASRRLIRDVMPNRGVQSLTFLPNGRSLVLARPRGMTVWNIETGTQLAAYTGHARTTFNVLPSPDGSILATASSDGSVKFWPLVVRPAQLRRFSSSAGSWIAGVAFTPDGTRLLTTRGPDNSFQMWNRTGKLLREFKGHTKPVLSVAVFPDGKRVLSGSEDQTIRLWDIETGRELLQMKGHTNTVRSVAFSPDGKLALSAGTDKTARLWSVKTGKELHRYDAGKLICAASFTPDGKQAVFPDDKQTILWNVETGKVARRFAKHETQVVCAAVSPDGKTVLSGDYSGELVLRDLQTGREIRRLKGHTDRIRSIAFSRDGRRVATGSYDKTIIVWDAATGRIRKRLKGHGAMVLSLEFSPDGQTLLSGGGDRTARLWDVSTDLRDMNLADRVPNWKSARTIPQLKPGLTKTVQDRLAYAAATSPDFKHLAITSQNKTVRIVDTATGKLVKTLQGHTDRVLFCAYSPDGKTLATSGYDKTIRLWNVASGESRAVLRGHEGRVSCVRFTPDGKQLISCGMQGNVFAWDPETGKQLGAFPKKQPGLIRIAVSPDGKLLAGGGWSKLIHLWSIPDRRFLSTLKGHAERVESLAFSPDGRTLVSGAFSKDPGQPLRVWDVKTRSLRATPDDKLTGVFAVSFSPDGRTFVTSGFDRQLRFWDTETSQLLASVVSGHRVDVRSLLWSPDGKQLISTCLRGLMKVWNVSESPVPWIPGYTTIAQHELPVVFDRTLVNHGEQARMAVFSPDGSLLATGGDDRDVKLWDAKTLKLKHTLAGHRGTVTFGEFSPDGRILATCSYDSTARLWDAASGKLLRVLKGHSAGLRQVTFSPDGNLVVTCSEDRTARIWETATGKHLKTIATDKRAYSVDVSPDGKSLVVGTGDWKAREDGVVTLYEFPSGRKIKELSGAKGPIWSVTFLPDGRRVAVANAKALGASLWNTQTGQMERVLQYPKGVRLFRVRPGSRWLTIAYGAHGYRNGSVAVWDLAGDTRLCRFQVTTGNILSAEVSPDGKLIATSAADGDVKIYRISETAEASVSK